MRTQLSPDARRRWSLPADPWLLRGAGDVLLPPGHRDALEAMVAAAEAGGLLAVVGAPGAGKTTLRRLLDHRLRQDSRPVRVVEPIAVDRSRLTAALICEAIIDDLSEERPLQSAEYRTRQARRIVSEARTALVIDEAHELAPATLRYLKRFHELGTTGFEGSLGVIVLAQPEILPRLDEARSWETRELARRIALVRVPPLAGAGEIEGYVTPRLPGVQVAAEAWDAIRERLTVRDRDGVEVSTATPLGIADLVTRGLNLTASLDLQRLTATAVRQA